MDTVFDIGLFNGLDTAYYLELGFKVVAVEANPTLIERAKVRFSERFENGRLVLLNGAISDADGQVELIVSGDDVGSSSILPTHVQTIQPIGAYTVPSIRFPSLIDKHGVPYFLKIDIEGSDRHCILPLTTKVAPKFLSYEIGSDFEELFAHVRKIGYTEFKIIDQSSFPRYIEITITVRSNSISINALLSASKTLVSFVEMVVSSAPGVPAQVPWRSDGGWRSPRAIEALWASKIRPGEGRSWYDLQAGRSL